jgi:hypothetical protein
MNTCGLVFRFYIAAILVVFNLHSGPAGPCLPVSMPDDWHRNLGNWVQRKHLPIIPIAMVFLASF